MEAGADQPAAALLREVREDGVRELGQAEALLAPLPEVSGDRVYDRQDRRIVPVQAQGHVRARVHLSGFGGAVEEVFHRRVRREAAGLHHPPRRGLTPTDFEEATSFALLETRDLRTGESGVAIAVPEPDATNFERSSSGIERARCCIASAGFSSFMRAPCSRSMTKNVTPSSIFFWMIASISSSRSGVHEIVVSPRSFSIVSMRSIMASIFLRC